MWVYSSHSQVLLYKYTLLLLTTFTPASSTTKTGPHDIAEILLKVALKHQQFKKNCFPTLILKLYVLLELFPFKVDKGPPFKHSSMNITYIFHYILL